MVRKIKAKAIPRLNGQGLSGRAIARSLGIARRSVAEVLSASAAAGIAYPDVAANPDDEVYGSARFFAQIGCWPAVGVTFMPLRLGCHRAGTCPCIAGPTTSVR